MSKYDKHIDDLIRLRIRWEHLVEWAEEAERETSTSKALDYLKREMSENAKAWLEAEPTFPKQIARPLAKRPPDKLPVYPIGGLDCDSSELLKRHNSSPKADATNKLADQTLK